MDIRERLQTEFNVRVAELAGARAKMKEAEREANRDKRPLEKAHREVLQAEINYRKGNLVACEAALGAARKFPPLSRLG